MMRRERTLVLVAAATFLYGCTGTRGRVGVRTPTPVAREQRQRQATPAATATGCPAVASRRTPSPARPGHRPRRPGAAAETPGRTPLRRLTRAQYNNTVRDLLGLSRRLRSTLRRRRRRGRLPVQPDLAGQRAAGRAVQPGGRGPGHQGGRRRPGQAGPLRPAPDRRGRPAPTQFVRQLRQARLPPPADPRGGGALQGGLPGGPGATAPTSAAGVTLVIAAMLQSPNFLYLPEIGDASGRREGRRPARPLRGGLAPVVLPASAACPTTSCSPPPTPTGLRTPEQVAAQTRRLLGSPRARESIVSFFQPVAGDRRHRCRSTRTR